MTRFLTPVLRAEGRARPRAEAKRPPGGAVGRCPVVPTGRDKTSTFVLALAEAGENR